MSPVVVAALVAVTLVGLIVGAHVFGDIFKSRAQLIREQRVREDAAMAANRSSAEFDRNIQIAFKFLDPIGIFTG